MRDSPFIVGGDFNMNPSMLEDSGFLEMAGCSLLAPPSGLGTCKASAGTTSSIDYFLADKSLAAGVKMVEVCTEVNFNPHRAVRTVFHPRLATLKALAFRKPEKLPV
eukprot:10448829-Heterocapsa_arctica.AAC.1